MRTRPRSLAASALAICVALPAAAGSRQTNPEPAGALAPRAEIADGDAHYARREQGHVGALAEPSEILAAIASYEAAARSPDDARARWKLSRALYFRGTYTSLDAGQRRAVYDRARRVSDEGIAVVARRDRVAGTAGLPPLSSAAALRSDPDAAPSVFWGAVAWGQWALSVGKLQAARMGAASRIRDTAQLLIAVDPEFEEGGGYRILGRLHDEAPRIPFVTWWVSRGDALTNLRKAMAVAPRNPINLHFLAEALFRGSASEKEEARRLEGQVVALPPDPARLVEELHVQDEARRNLAQWAR